MRWGFDEEKLNEDKIAKLKKLARLSRGDILKMTTVAASGHPGGSMSSIDIYLTLYSCARIYSDNPYSPDRDRIVISHGHTSPGVYATLARLGFFDIDSVIANFRRAGSLFEGHVERDVPGVEWGTGNLGQGLSVGCGFALASKLQNRNFQVFVVMGDGEQSKGQIGEARRFARKYSLNSLTVIVDCNRLQLSGSLNEIMPQRIKENYLSDGWQVLEINGHSYQEIYQALREAVIDRESPVAILARTVMSKGVSFMEDKFEYHGKPLSLKNCRLALSELGLEDDLDTYSNLRKVSSPSVLEKSRPIEKVHIEVGSPHTYKKGDLIDNRSAFGEALADIAKINKGKKDRTPIAVFDCDLLGSVKTDKFASLCPQRFFQGGIQEHNTASLAGALSTQGVLTFFADFGVFGVDETYNQHRLNDINRANLKLVCTHNGIDVGQDGKTHQCIDYAGVINNLYGYRMIVPADANQTDRAIRYIAAQPGNFFVGMGRSKFPVILNEKGEPFFAGTYEFVHGKADIVRDGDQAAIISMGGMLYRAIQAWETLKKKDYYVKVINVACLSDMDVKMIREAARTGVIITYEDHNVKTGLGSIVANVLAENSLSPRFRKLGSSGYGGSGKPDDLFKMQGLGINSLVQTTIQAIQG